MAIDFLEHVRSESARFGEVLRDTDPAARVPSCPDWSADDLLYHLAEVFDNWTKVLAEGKAGDEFPPPDRPGEHAGVVDLYDRSTAALLDVLASTPGDKPMWSWVADEVTASWLSRRMAHEALIHRLDAELTADAVSDFDAALAADGVAEVLYYFFGWHPTWATLTPGTTVGRLAATDTGNEWLVRFDSWSGHSPDSGKTYDGESFLSIVDAGDPSYSVQASARDLDAWLWNRPTITAPKIDGDASVLQAVVADGLQ
jgi:uncharacterized protein (TIGR03083 family)